MFDAEPRGTADEMRAIRVTRRAPRIASRAAGMIGGEHGERLEQQLGVLLGRDEPEAGDQLAVRDPSPRIALSAGGG